MVVLRALAFRALALCSTSLSSLGPASASVAICGITEFNTAAECAAWGTRYEEESTCARERASGLLVLGPGARFQDFRINDGEMSTSDPSLYKEYTGTGSEAYECVVNGNVELNGLGNETMDVNSITLQGASATFQRVTITDDNTGDDGMELFDSNVTLERLTVINAGDDGVDLDDGSRLVVTSSLIVKNTGTMARANKAGAAVEIGTGAHINLKRFEFSKPNTFGHGHWYFKNTWKDGHVSDGLSIKMGRDNTHFLTESTWTEPIDAPSSTAICGIKVIDSALKCQDVTGIFTVAHSCSKPTGILVIGAGEFSDFKVGLDGAASPLRATFGSSSARRFSCAIGNIELRSLGSLVADVNSITFKGVDVTIESLRITGEGIGDDGVELFDSTVIVKGLLEVEGAGDDFVDLDRRSKVDIRGELRITGLNAGTAGVEMNGRSQFFARKVTFDHPASRFGEGHFYLKSDNDGTSCPANTDCYADVDVMASYRPPLPLAAVGSTDAASERGSAVLLQAFVILVLATLA